MKDISEIHDEYRANPTESYFYDRPIDYILMNTLLQYLLDSKTIGNDSNIIDLGGESAHEVIMCGGVGCNNKALLGVKRNADTDIAPDVPLCVDCARLYDIRLGEGNRRIIGGMLMHSFGEISAALQRFPATVESRFIVSGAEF